MKNLPIIRCLMIFLVLGMACSAVASFDYASIDELPPGERYRQLSLLLLISGGADADLLNMLQPVDDNGAELEEQGGFTLKLEDYGTPLARIVDQDTMLAGAAHMIRFAQEHSPEIQARLTTIASENPILISMVDVNEIAGDAIIIRNAIADSIEYSDRIDDPAAGARLAAFREQTVYLRNMMEYNIFQEELAELTDESIIDMGGRLDAYQRMFDDEIDQELIQRRIDSAEMMNQQTGTRFDEQAAMRTNELLMMLILMESQVR
jgi:hypothetical protein